MKTLKIKRVFPGQTYSMRKATVKTNLGQKFKVGQFQTLEIPIEGVEWVQFSIDYHKKRLYLKSEPTGKNEFAVFTLKMRDGFPANLIDSFSNAMRAEFVSQKDFDEFDAFAVQKSENLAISWREHVAIIAILSSSLVTIASSIFYDGLPYKELLFIIGLLGSFSAIGFWTTIKNTNLVDYNLFIKSSLGLFILVLGFFGLPVLAKTALATALLLVIGIGLSWKNQE